MPKKFAGGAGEDTRGLKAKAQKAAAAAQKASKQARAKDAAVAAEWREGSNTRQADRAAAARDKEEERRRKQQLKLQAAKEDAAAVANVAARRKPNPKAGGKNKKADPLASLGDLSFMKKAKKTKKKFGTSGGKKPLAGSGSRTPRVETSADDELESAGVHRNTNRQRAAEAAEGHVDASGIDNAVAALGGAGDGGGRQKADMHPERRMKAAWAAFEAREMPILKATNPGLKRSQLQQRLHKAFEKSPDNPLNQQ